MTYETAKILLANQDRSFRMLNNLRFTLGDYEYRLTYVGGFAAYVAIDRRKIGKRNFKYYPTVDIHRCRTGSEALEEIIETIKERLERES